MLLTGLLGLVLNFSLNYNKKSNEQRILKNLNFYFENSIQFYVGSSQIGASLFIARLHPY